MDYRQFWYVLAESKELQSNYPLGRKILDEWIAVFRDEKGRAVAVQDRCLHRAGRLSKGSVQTGRLRCPYHGWIYDGRGKVVSIPSFSEESNKIGHYCTKVYSVIEQDGYVYICLAESPTQEQVPFRISHYAEKCWKTVRVTNRFNNNVTNCVENFVDIPHTAFVHPGIFRSPKNEKIFATVERKNGSVQVRYKNENSNLGIFAWFLNPSKREIIHTDSFHMPNITSVEYVFGPNRHFIITSQSVPVAENETIVYTDLTYNYGIWNFIAGFFVKRQGQKIIDQDMNILADQMDVIKRYGTQFSHSPVDIIHVFIESIRDEIASGRDPRKLPECCEEVEFLI